MRDGISQNAGNESRGVAESQRRRHDGTRGRRGRLSPRHEATPFCTCFFIARRAFLRFFFAFEVRPGVRHLDAQAVDLAHETLGLQPSPSFLFFLTGSRFGIDCACILRVPT